jgi:hypothetical protein
MLQVAQVTVYSQTNTKHINTGWAECTIVKMFNLLVHPVTSRLWMVKEVQNKPNVNLYIKKNAVKK